MLDHKEARSAALKSEAHGELIAERERNFKETVKKQIWRIAEISSQIAVLNAALEEEQKKLKNMSLPDLPPGIVSEL